MATPGNFGGGSKGPDQIFLGITRTPSSAPGRAGGAQKAEPPGHKALAVEVSYQQSARNRKTCLGFSKQTPTRRSRLRIWFLDVVHRPAVLKGDPIDQN
jgi:hypothetical protein